MHYSRLVITSLMLFLINCSSEGQVIFKSSNLPIVVINTNGQVIKDEPKITADMGIIDNGSGKINNITDPFNNYKGKIGIEIRGASSQMFPKKQYAVETRDSLGNNVDAALMGLPADKDWVLSAPYTDKTLMRDALMYKLANSIGRYASRSRFCELVLNNEYMGVYILFEKMKRGSKRVNITKMGSADVSGDALTGGYLLQIDRNEGTGSGWYSNFAAVPGYSAKPFYQYVYPKDDDIVDKQKEYIKNKMNSFETIMYSSSFNDTAVGYSKLIDVSSLVDFILMNELSKNVDAYRLSTYLYKDRDSKGGGKLVFGPVWDYNLGFGNANYYDCWKTGGWQVDFLTTNTNFLNTDNIHAPIWFRKIFYDEPFKSKLVFRWNELRKQVINTQFIYGQIDSLTVLLNEAQQRNYVKWPILGKYIWPNYFIGKTYNEEIAYMKKFISDRMSWMDLEISKFTGIDDNQQNIPTNFVLHQNYPNPFNPSTIINFSVPKEGDVSLVVFDMLGKQVAVLADGRMQRGEHSVAFKADGLPTGVYFCRLMAGDVHKSIKMLLIR